MHKLKMYRATGFTFCLLMWLCALPAFSQTSDWEALQVKPVEGSCPEIYERIWPAPLEYTCAPHELSAEAMRDRVDQLLKAKGDNIPAKDAWVKHKAGKVRLESLNAIEWQAWWVPKNEPYVVRVVRTLNVEPCMDRLRTAGFEPPQLDLTDTASTRFSLNGKPVPFSYPERGLNSRMNGITLHIVRVDESGRVVASCPVFESPKNLGYLAATRETFNSITLEVEPESRTDAEADSSAGADAHTDTPNETQGFVSAERFLVREFVLDQGAIAKARWKIFMDPSKFSVDPQLIK